MSGNALLNIYDFKMFHIETRRLPAIAEYWKIICTTQAVWYIEVNTRVFPLHAFNI